MRRVILSLAAVALGTAGAAVAQRKFGPEWTRVKSPQGGEMLTRKVTADVSHWPGGNVSTYRLPLERGEISVSQDDEFHSTSVRFQGGTELDVLFDGAGKPKEHRIILGNSVYFDLDGDGRIDALYEPRGGNRQPFIVMDGRHIEVEDNKNAFDGRRKWGVGRNEEYLFEDGKWRKI